MDEKNIQLEQFLSAMQLGQLNLADGDAAFESFLKLPKQLLECCAALSLRPGLVRVEIPSAMRKIVDVSTQTKAILNDIEEAIEQESQDYKVFRRADRENLSDNHEGFNDDDEDSALSSSDESENRVNRR